MDGLQKCHEADSFWSKGMQVFWDRKSKSTVIKKDDGKRYDSDSRLWSWKFGIDS